MAINIQKWGIFGAIVGAGFPLVLKYVVPLIPGVSVQSTLSLPLQQVNTTLGSFVMKTLGMGSIGFPEIAWGALGGALAFVLGAFVIDALGYLKGGDVERIAAVTLVSSVLVAAIISMQVHLPSMNEAIVMVIGSFVTAFIVVGILNLLGQKNYIP
jgi:hypothetical protein